MRRLRVLGAIGALALLGGCAAAPAEGVNAENAREALASLGEEIVASAGGDITDTDTGTARCEDGADEGVDWTSIVEFSAPEFSTRVQDAEGLLISKGYDVSFGTKSDEFHASGPDGETVVLTEGQLTLFTGCVVE